jgi:hypothetical protein
VIEGHHHEPQEDHRRHGADPVEVDGGDAVLRAVGRHPEDLERPEVGGDEGQAGYPRRKRSTGQEEVKVRLDRQSCDGADAEHDEEVDRQDRVVQRAGIEPEHGERASARA